MKDKHLIIIGAVLIIIFLIWQQHLIRDNPKDNYNEQILKRMDSLENRLKTLSDSNKVIIIKIDKELKHNEEHYEKLVDDIFVQSDSVNRKFIDSYIKQYIERITEN